MKNLLNKISKNKLKQMLGREYFSLLKENRNKTDWTRVGSKYKDLGTVADGAELSLDECIMLCAHGETKKIEHNFELNSWLDLKEDEQDSYLEGSFPFRTKVDKNLRNIRSSDITRFLKKLPIERKTILASKLDKYSYGQLDYIFVINICLMIGLCDASVLRFWSETDCIRLGTWAFVDKVKLLSDTIKTRKKGKYAWHCLVEMGCLAGYRNPPVEGFDLVVEAEKLAKGGEEHNFPVNFKQMASTYLTTQKRHSVKKMTLREFIADGGWATSGSSSIGYIEILDKTTMKMKKIKCRKNFVLDAESVDYLYELTLNTKTQVNKTLLKCELGKIRLAVASDLGTYIGASWIIYHAGGCYLNWPGVTLEENSIKKVDRMLDIKEKLSVGIGVPFDYASFDHQPETEELQDITQVIVDASVDLIGGEPEFLVISSNVVGSFDHSTLITRLSDGGIVTQEVEGGLMSGHRYTSVLGNGYNSCVSCLVIDCCVVLGEDRDDFYINVQGDDTNIICKSKRQALLILRLYQCFNIKFASGKFSIQIHNSEYLRVWLSTDATFSYPARTLPNLTQRKPWSNTPWGPAEVMRGIWDKIGILKRRGLEGDSLDTLWEVLSIRWCELHTLPVGCLEIPAELGGFGIGIWDGKTAITPKIPLIGKKGFSVLRKTEYRVERLGKECESLGLDASKYDLAAMADKQLEGVVSGDDVPDIAIINRKRWKAEILKTTFRLITLKQQTVRVNTNVDRFIHWYPRTGSEWKDGLSWLELSTTSYGRWRKEIEQMRKFKEFNNYRKDGVDKISISSWLKQAYPVFWDQLRKLRKRGHMTDILDYLAGEINLGENMVHNDVIDVYTRYVLKNIRTDMRRQDIKVYYSHLRKEMLQGFSSNIVYRYVYSSN